MAMESASDKASPERQADGVARVPAPGPVLRSLNDAAGALDAPLATLNGYSRADDALRAIAADVAGAAARAPAIAIACVLLNQVGGRYAIRHSIDSAVLTALVARALGQAEASVLTATAAALTMNVGMLAEIDVFHARATALGSAERERLRCHPQAGATLLRGAGVDDDDWLDGVLQHHETADGSGYPAGLRADAIAANAQLVGMADRYCACIGARNYRRSMLAPAALQLLAADHGARPALVHAFTRVLGAYPPGTLVRLHDGASGVVVDADADARLRVQVLRAADGSAVNAQRDGAVIDAALHEDDARLRFSMTSVWGELAAL